MKSINLSIWQIFYDYTSFSKLDKDFIPYDNTNEITLFFESDIISKIHKTHKELWSKSDYVGVLSWRFKEKTNLTGQLIKEHIKNNKNIDIYNLTPTIYDSFHSPYSKHGFGNVYSICEIIDKHDLFPFKLTGHDSLDEFKNFCNFFICKPKIFDDFVKNYLNKLMIWLQTCTDEKLLIELKKMVNHRGLYPIHPFIMEGLLECYVIYKGYTYERIVNDIKDNEKEIISQKKFLIKKSYKFK